MSLRLALALLCVGTLPACFYELGELNPTSSLVRAKSTQSLALRLGSGVKDALVLRTKTDASVKVARWHDTLLRGFHNGPEKLFAAAPSVGPSDFTIVIHKTELTLARYKNSELHFEAELLDGKQAVIKTWNDTVRTHVPLTGRIVEDRWTPFDRVAAAAIATLVGAMYDELGGLDGYYAK
jgi:hypothetical protein